MVLIGATNRRDAIDPAEKTGRFDRELEIGVPDKNGRSGVTVDIHTRGMPMPVMISRWIGFLRSRVVSWGQT